MSQPFESDLDGQPVEGDWIRIGDEHFQVMEKCPCGPDTMHVRWFLQGEDELGPLRLPVEAVLSKEWDDAGEIAWWFGRRIAISDVKTCLPAGRPGPRLPEKLRRQPKQLPKRIFYDGRPYRLLGKSQPPKELPTGAIPVTVWEYVDPEDTESVLLEISRDGETLAYHGWYANPDDLSVSH